ncbi:Uncharacterised protein [Mycobacteroides abscessus subsp. abscessus]|nr:Uncharacterised protein [Mycobacteroides abscessus subsp. abscessus]
MMWKCPNLIRPLSSTTIPSLFPVRPYRNWCGSSQSESQGQTGPIGKTSTAAQTTWRSPLVSSSRRKTTPIRLPRQC